MAEPVGCYSATDWPTPPTTSQLAGTALFRAEGWSRPFFLDAGTPYDVSPDGQRFVLRLSAARPEAVLVQKWKARLPR